MSHDAPIRGPALHDAEGDRVPAGVKVFDAHVHVFPDRLAAAVRRWFDEHGWPIRYALDGEATLRFLLERGVERIAALHYAHRPGMAEQLNDYVAALARRFPGVVGLATVMPGEPDAAGILSRAFRRGLRGVKLHCHVQKFAADEPRVSEVYEVAAEAGLPVVIHAGREPSSAAYGVDTRALCPPEAVARVLARYPTLRLVVPHLGADDYATYEQMLDQHPNLFLDTTMVVADYFPVRPELGMLSRRADRIIYGSDFPNLPYAWDRELKRLQAAGLSAAALRAILHDNAARLFDD